MDLLEIKGISKIYGSVKALQNIDLTVKQGEWLAIMGPSGSGKTTMMNIIGCMDKPTEGSVILDGTDISKENAKNLTAVRREKIGLIFQQFHLINYLTAVENVMVAQYYHSMPDEAEALRALERVGLLARAKHLPSQLSGGEQQRVCIARALINYPMLVLADEPTGNLDEANENIVLDIFKQLHKDGVTIVVVTHDPEVADEAERTVVLEHGRIARIVYNDAGDDTGKRADKDAGDDTGKRADADAALSDDRSIV
ncbi:MAG: ABC transporter ATP-binding protein [Clostridiales Family XIII bacterium]|jgi:putative ABC transport system ATP-binding protein|nr:ABC transporter ATP-binding protein [Clostridiales Family XIII bacterium]